MVMREAVGHAINVVTQACMRKRAAEKFHRARSLRSELVKQAAEHPDMWKFAFGGVPFSSLTARSALAAGLKPPEPETDRRGMLQRQLEQLLAGMKPSRARIVDARRQGRESVQRRTP